MFWRNIFFIVKKKLWEIYELIYLMKTGLISIKSRGKEILEHLSKPRFLRSLKIVPFLPCCVAAEKSPRFSNSVKNRAFESFSNMSFPLVCNSTNKGQNSNSIFFSYTTIFGFKSSDFHVFFVSSHFLNEMKGVYCRTFWWTRGFEFQICLSFLSIKESENGPGKEINSIKVLDSKIWKWSRPDKEHFHL